MNDPERLILASSNERTLLRAGLDMDPPPGAKDEVLRALELTLAATAGVVSAHAVAATIPSATPSVPSGAGTMPAAKVVATKLAIAKVLGIVGLSSVVIAGAALAGRALRFPAGGSPAGGRDSQPVLAVRAADGDASNGDYAETSLAVPDDRDTVSRGTRLIQAAGATAELPTADSESSQATQFVAPADERLSGATAPSTRVGSVAEKRRSATAAADSAPSSGASSPMEDESEAFVRARGLMRGGDPAGAVRALDEMQERFKGGGLAEERASLYVEALAASGRAGLARRYADALITAHPGSALADRVRGYATSGK
jgi:hypothetical protein